jgi:hypothetical protein
MSLSEREERLNRGVTWDRSGRELVPGRGARRIAPQKQETERKPRGRPPRAELAERPHDLYRLFDSAWVLLYVGWSISTISRLSGHKSDKPWWHEVVHIRVEKFPNLAAADAAETLAIQTEKPKYNIAKARGAQKTSGDWTTEEMVAQIESNPEWLQFCGSPSFYARKEDGTIDQRQERLKHIAWLRSFPPGTILPGSRVIHRPKRLWAA